MSMKSAFYTVVLVLAVAIAAVALVGLSGCASHQVAVTRDELPAAVKATLDRETAGGTVTELEKETKDGKTCYCADAKIDGKAWDICIAEDGSLISKKRD